LCPAMLGSKDKCQKSSMNTIPSKKPYTFPRILLPRTLLGTTHQTQDA
jgi:hypothetical protein